MNLKKAIRRIFVGETGAVDGALFRLTDEEKWWRDRYAHLESHGYRLRERLQPGWMPSWEKNPELRPEDCEDSVSSAYTHIAPVTRISDGLDVVIKRLSKDTDERSIAVLLSEQEDERNHCVPIIDTFADELDDKIEYIVMPLLREFYLPPFYAVEEVIDFLRQTLEGIVFMHDKDVAHRDCSDLNIMMEGRSLYPDGFHPIYRNMDRQLRGEARFKNRRDTKGVKYYFTDFGMSTRFDESDGSRLVTGSICAADVPELSDSVPYNPFAIDIYLLGDVYQRYFIEQFRNVQFLKPLVESMLQRDPSCRLSGHDALKRLESLVSQRPGYILRWRLLRHNSGRISRFFINMNCTCREGIFVARKLVGVPHLVERKNKA